MVKKILCLVLIIMMLLTCVGCGSPMEKVQETQQQQTSNKSMFVLVESNYLWNKYNIVYHKETKVMYAVSCNTQFTVMLDADGKPLLWEG